MQGLDIYASVDSSPCCSAESSSDPLGNWRTKGLDVATCGKHEDFDLTEREYADS